MSIPELIFGFALPLLILLVFYGLTRRWNPTGPIISIALTLMLGEIGLTLLARKWSSWETSEDGWKLLSTAIDKFVTPTIAMDWLPAALVSFAISYLILLLVRNLTSSIGKMLFLVVQLSLLMVLIYAMLSTSKYISREPEIWKRVAHVAVPSLLLWSGWIVAAFSPLKRQGTTTNNDGSSSEVKASGESRLGWLSALAIVLSATLLILSSGSASTALQAAVAVVVPLALFWDGKFAAAHSSVFWLHSTVGIIVIMGHFFAEVTWYAGVSCLLSSCLLIRYWPKMEQPLGQRWLQAFGIAAPALAIALYAAIQLAIAMSGTAGEY